MIWSVVVVAGLVALALALGLIHRYLFFGALGVYGVLAAISFGLGYPTNTSFPSHAIVYGLTTEYVWAGTPDDPTPRAYIFQAPPEWFEERDKRNGQPFEVEEEMEGEESEGILPGSDRTSEGWKIHPSVLPPKES